MGQIKKLKMQNNLNYRRDSEQKLTNHLDQKLLQDFGITTEMNKDLESITQDVQKLL